MVTSLMDAQLIALTNMDGLYDKDPRVLGCHLISGVQVNKEILKCAGDAPEISVPAA
jgi:glutamate 5-kinase